MRIEIKRPVIWIAISYIVGILLSSLIKEVNWIFWVTAFFCLVITFLCLIKNKSWAVYYLLSVFILLGIANAETARIDSSGLERFEGSTINLTGQVLEVVGYDDARAVYTIRVKYIEFEGKNYSTNGKIRLSTYFNEEKEKVNIFKSGEFIRVNGEIKKPQGRRNPRGFDYRAYLERQGIFFILNVKSHQVKLVGNKPFPWPYSWIIGVHNRIQNIMEKNLKDPALSLIKSMIIGDKTTLPNEIQNDFSQTGLAHILAISGLHVGFIVLMLVFIERIFKIPSRLAFIVQVFILSFYCILAGARVSVIRAFIMAIIALGGKRLGRKPDPINSMALAALLILIFRPLDIFDVGFQLSFAAVGGIFLCNSSVKKMLKFLPGFISNPISISLSAQLGTWPIILYYFNIFSPLAIIVNLLMVPLAGLIVISGFIMLIVSPVMPWMGSFLGYIVEIMCLLLIKGNSIVASIPCSSIKMISPSIIFLIVYYWILWIISDDRPLFVKKPGMWFSGAIIFLLTLIIVKSLLPVPLQIVFLDVGQGDCIYIRTPDRKHILVDGGGSPEGTGSFDVGENIVVPFLLKNGIWHLDLVIMSHAHDDHIEGLISVVKDLKVGAFMEFPPENVSSNYLILRELIDNKGITCIHATGGQKYQVGEKVWLDILYPVEQLDLIQGIDLENENNRSLVIRLVYQDTSVLLTGDIEREVEDYLLDIYEFEVDILKVPHHGSITSSIEPWIKVLKPDIAVIQVGNNMFGHPHPEVENRLKEQGATVYRNDVDGAVICSFKNGEWWVDTMVK